MIAALERIAAEPVEVEPAAAGHENPLAGSARVEEALQVVAPPVVLVDLVEDPELRGLLLP